MTEVETREAELAVAKQALDEAREIHATAVRKLEEARVAAACESAHEWAGKKVKRVVTQRGSVSGWSRSRTPDRDVKQTGIVTLNGMTKNWYRNHNPAKGEWFVLSESGKTAYSLSPDWKLA